MNAPDASPGYSAPRPGSWVGSIFRRGEKPTTGPKSWSLQEVERLISEAPNPTQKRLAMIVRDLEMTAGARFEASRRHKKKNRTSVLSTLVLSLYAMMFSMITTMTPLNQSQKELLSMASIFMSSLIIGFTFYESSKRHDARSEAFLRCASSIIRLRDEALTTLMIGTSTEIQVTDLEHKYHMIMGDFSTDSHAVLDYRAHQVSAGNITGLSSYYYVGLNLLNIWWVPIVAIFSPAAIYYTYIFVRHSVVLIAP